MLVPGGVAEQKKAVKTSLKITGKKKVNVPGIMDKSYFNQSVI